MKFYVFAALIVLLFASCSSKPSVDNTVAENRKLKNQETALKNEVSIITREAQKLEKQGRGMEIFRQANNAENMRECTAAMTEAQPQVKDLEARIKILPNPYITPLTPITADLNECVSCSKEAIDGCVKARASINKAIKEIYPQ